MVSPGGPASQFLPLEHLLPFPYKSRHVSSTSLKFTLAFVFILKQLPIALGESEVYGKNTSSIAQGPVWQELYQ